MPIKGLTTKRDIQPHFPRIGKLRKGGERVEKTNQEGKTFQTYGPDLDHFRFTSDRPEVAEAFKHAYGEKPTVLRVHLPYPTAEKNFQTWKEEWGAGGLKHRCDGERTVIWQNAKGEYVTDPAQQKACPGGCDEVGYLEVILPELVKAGYMGTITIETHSINDLVCISSALMKAEEECDDDVYGMRSIGFIVRRVPENISTPGFGANKGKRQRTKKFLVKIEPDPQWVISRLERMERDALDGRNGHAKGISARSSFASLDEDQMAALIQSEENVRAAAALSDQERIARMQEHVRAMRGDPDHDPFDDAPPPPGVVDGEFTKVEDPASTEKAAEQPATTPAPPAEITSEQADKIAVLLRELYPKQTGTHATTLLTARYQKAKISELNSPQADDFIGFLTRQKNGEAN